MSDLTIVIPTHDRPGFLERVLAYYEPLDFGDVVVADSSDEDTVRHNATLCERVDRPIEHTQYDESISLISKIADVLQTVETEYVLLCADDDFVTPTGVRRAVEFLADNPDFSAAHGHFISFEATLDDGAVSFDWEPLYLHARSRTQRRARQRLYEHFAGYFTTFYSVHRTTALRNGFECAAESTDDVRFGELLPSMLTMIDGKFKYLDVFYGARCWDEQLGATVDHFLDFARRGTFRSKHVAFRRCLVDHLCAADELSEQAAIQTVDSGMIAYLEHSYGIPGATGSTIVAGDESADVPMPGDLERQTTTPVKTIQNRLAASSPPEPLEPAFETVSHLARWYKQRLWDPDGFDRKRFYALLGLPLVDGSDELDRIRETVVSHPAPLE